MKKKYNLTCLEWISFDSPEDYESGVGFGCQLPRRHKGKHKHTEKTIDEKYLEQEATIEWINK